MIQIPNNKKLILFDGVCNLCNTAVATAIKYDKNNAFLFASLQSKTGKELVDYLKIDMAKIDSIILYEPNIAYDIKSTAALKIMNAFGGFWSLTKLLWLFPESFRDLVYDFIAKNRYKWFGKRESCMLPTAELKAKFLN
ncbi:DCC1-like thiol-disulfide oxidoreductase family protein [uncultured Polaribacter sp.]|uniref:thiol-disulfide oxidoreductase DCC family protein n=1 Tax=uncultured Polaribacter sp. TaxID=174711 RepID=UPI00261EDD5B|nr:DCC1-like thiol-disulfide oxidoreductase family protein [uncultured Polaribacter sp.]